MDDVTLGKLLTEAHRGQADYCEPEGMSVSQSSSSVVFDGSGQPDGKRMSINQFILVSQETRTVLTASFLKTPELRKWSMDQGNFMSETERTRRLGLYLKSRDRRLSIKSQSSRTPCSSRRRRAPTPTRTIMATEIVIS